MVKAPQYEAMDEARVAAIPEAFTRIFGAGFSLKVEEPRRSDPPAAGPVPRPTHHIFKGLRRLATIYPNGHVECMDEGIRDKMEQMARIIEEAAAKAYNTAMGRGH
jgi:hypothetical protein